MVSIITIYTNAAVIMTTAIVVIKNFTHCMSIATKTVTKFLKSLKRQFVLLFQDNKRIQKFNFHFSFKNRSYFIILPTKFISLTCTASQNSPARFLINELLFYSKSKTYVFLNPFKTNILIIKKPKVLVFTTKMYEKRL